MEWKSAFAPHRGVSRGITSTGFVVTLCIVKGIFLAPYCCFYKGHTSESFRFFSVHIEVHFLGVEIGVCSISWRFKGHIFDRFCCYSLYSEGHFVAPYCYFYKWHTSESFRPFSVYIEGHFLSGNRRLLNIAASQGAYFRQVSFLLCV